MNCPSLPALRCGANDKRIAVPLTLKNVSPSNKLPLITAPRHLMTAVYRRSPPHIQSPSQHLQSPHHVTVLSTVQSPSPASPVVAPQRRLRSGGGRVGPESRRRRRAVPSGHDRPQLWADHGLRIVRPPGTQTAESSDKDRRPGDWRPRWEARGRRRPYPVSGARSRSSAGPQGRSGAVMDEDG